MRNRADFSESIDPCSTEGVGEGGNSVIQVSAYLHLSFDFYFWASGIKLHFQLHQVMFSWSSGPIAVLSVEYFHSAVCSCAAHHTVRTNTLHQRSICIVLQAAQTRTGVSSAAASRQRDSAVGHSPLSES